MSDLKITNLEFIKNSVIKLAETLKGEKQIRNLNSVRFKYDFLLNYHHFADASPNEVLIVIVDFRTIYDFPKQENGTFYLSIFNSMQKHDGMDEVVKSIENSFRAQLQKMHRLEGAIEEISTIVPF